MRPRLVMLLGLLAACAIPEPLPPGPPPPPPPPSWQGLEEAPATHAPIRFRAEGDKPVRISQLESRTTVLGPIAWTELSLKVDNLGVADAHGALELELAASTSAALEAPSRGDPSPLVELRGPARAGARLFRSQRRTIPGSSSVTIALRHAMVLSGPERSGRLSFAGLSSLERARVVVSELGAAQPMVDAQLGPAPLADVLVRAGAAPVASAGSLELTLTQAPAAQGAVAPVRGLVLLLDTSAARAHDLKAQARLARDLTSRLSPDTKLSIAAYDLEVSELFEGRAGDVPRDLALQLEARGALGPSRTAQAVAWAIDRAGSTHDRVVVVGDGLDGLAQEEAAAIAAPLRERARGSDLRVDVITGSGARSVDAVVALARDVAPRRGRVTSLYDAPADAVLGPDGAPGEASAWASPVPLEVAAPGSTLVVAKLTAGGGGAPDWTTRGLGEPPRPRRPFDRVAALEKSARPFYGSEVDRQELDPLSALEPGKKSPSDATAPLVEVAAAPVAEGQPAPAPKGTLPPQTIQDIVRKNLGRARACYQDALRRAPAARGRVVVRFSITPAGPVSLARALSSEIEDSAFIACVVGAFEQLDFPASERDPITVTYPLVLDKSSSKEVAAPVASGNPVLKGAARAPLAKAPKEPWLEDLAPIYQASLRGDHALGAELARRLVDGAPERPLGYLALGDAWLAAGRAGDAARAYGSLLDLDAADAGALRLAAGRLAALGSDSGRELAEQGWLAAIELAPEDPRAFAALAALRAQAGRLEEALVLLDLALARAVDPARHPGLREIVRHDLGAYAAALVAKQGVKKVRLERWLADVGAKLSGPSQRATLRWEGNADLDLLVRDAGLSLANKVTPALTTGGRLLGDAPGGPSGESFLLDLPPASRSAPYAFSAALASSLDPFVAGDLELQELGPEGELTFLRRPLLLQVPGSELAITSAPRSLAK